MPATQTPAIAEAAHCLPSNNSSSSSSSSSSSTSVTSTLCTATLEAVHREAGMLTRLSHAHIVRCVGTCTDADARRAYILMEYVPGGSLHQLLSEFGALLEDNIMQYTRQLLVALQYLHGEGVVHGDVKGANVLVTPGGQVKLADFGCATYVQDVGRPGNARRSLVGTTSFMAPESACHFLCVCVLFCSSCMHTRFIHLACLFVCLTCSRASFVGIFVSFPVVVKC
jgi:serine/threonine protein kinase